MKFNTQGLALVMVFQLFIVGATLSITATNAGAAALPCAVPETASDKVSIGTCPVPNSEQYKNGMCQMSCSPLPHLAYPRRMS